MATPWLSIRGEVSGGRSALLTACSFLLPLALWCVVSYVPPFTWHPDVLLHIAGDRDDAHTVYTAGDRVPSSHFERYRDGVAAHNRRLEELLAAAAPLPTATAREQRRTLRHLAPWAIRHGHLSRDDLRNDDAIYALWRDVAEGRLPAQGLNEANHDIVRRNWQALAAAAATDTEHQRHALPSSVLWRLEPQGRPANPIYLPAPHEVMQAGLRLITDPPPAGQPTMGQRLLHSLRIVFGGFLIAAAIGIPIGILCGTFPAVARLCEPFIDFFRYMPAPVFGTLLVAIFAAHDAPKIAMVFMGTFFQLVLVVAKTTRQLDRSLLEAAQTLGANNRRLLLRVIVPGILPNLYNDMRILLGWAWTWLVIAELVGVKTGLTDFIDTQGRYRNFDRVFPVIFLIGLIGFTTDQLLAFCRPYLFPWCGDPRPGIVARCILGPLAMPILAVSWARQQLRQQRDGAQS